MTRQLGVYVPLRALFLVHVVAIRLKVMINMYNFVFLAIQKVPFSHVKASALGTYILLETLEIFAGRKINFSLH